MAITDDVELGFLIKRANACGCFVQRHRVADPMDGDLYLQERRSRGNPKPPSIVRYATADQVHAALERIERQQNGRALR